MIQHDAIKNKNKNKKSIKHEIHHNGISTELNEEFMVKYNWPLHKFIQMNDTN